MRVEDIMKRPVITASMDARIDTVRRMFEKHKIHHILVVDKDRLVGIVSDRDILRRLSPFLTTASELPRDRSTLDKRMHQIMTRDLITADKDMPVEAAADTFVKKGISCLPVVTPDDEVLGIITWRDVLRNIEYRA